MTNHFLHYWKPETADREMERGGPLEHIGSEQLTPQKAKPGDTIWIATVAKGELILLGRLIVGEVLDGRDAAVERFGTDDLWEAQYTVVAEADTAEPLNPVNITVVADKLRFQSKGAPKLNIVDGRVNAQQLQSTRLLTAESADLLEECWETDEQVIEGDASEGAV